jgi:predicted NodU family carbamoyl transferase
MRDNSVVSCKMENVVSPYFPRESAEAVLSESGVDISKVDYLVFLGKPFSYFERIIDAHIALFPRSFLRFFTDIKDIFNNKLRIKAIAKKSLNFQNDICYIELTDAIGWQISKEHLLEDITVIVLLRDSLSSRVGGRYQKKGGELFLNQELRYAGPVNSERSSELMKEELKELLSFEKRPLNDKIIVASNCSFPPGFKEEFSGETGSQYNLRLLNDREIFEYAGRYVFEGVEKWR